MWLLSNKPEIAINGSISPITFQGYNAWFQGQSVENKQDTSWYIEGYVSTRESDSDRLQKNDKLSLIAKLFTIYGDAFIDHIKGNFIIVHLFKDGFKIYSDRFGIRKFFIWTDGKEFIISDSLKLITQMIHSEISNENIAIYALTYHFTGGRTVFKNITHNTPGQLIEFYNGKIVQKQYWSPGYLLNIPKRKIEIIEISDSLKKAVKSCIEESENTSYSLSLTGGADTRNLLAIFLSMGIRPHIYTYGNPASSDCVAALNISKGLNLQHDIYDIKMTDSLFEQYARKIIRAGNSLSSIHRAHRYIAIEKERQYANKMFLGTLGGEFIKGVSEDDYIVPAIVCENWEKPSLDIQRIVTYFNRKNLKTESIDIQYLSSYLNDEIFLKGDKNQRKLIALSHITAHLHDAQDIVLFNNVMNEVFTPFLDIDYLENVFASSYTFEVKEEVSNRFLRRMNNPIYSSEFLKVTYPALLRYNYAGEHNPGEVLFNKYYAGALKIIRQRLKKKYPPNFPLDKWMVDFVQKNLPLCNDFKQIRDVFDIPALSKEFQHNTHVPKESYWLKFTNPIFMRLIIEEYGDK